MKDTNNPNITVLPNKKEQAKTDQELVSKIKPKLEKFLIDEQVNKASATAHDTYKETTELIDRMTKEQADMQASKIAMRAFLDTKLWEKHLPPLELSWLTGKSGVDGHRLSEKEIKSEFAREVSGFSSYLVREWDNMRERISKGEYPNPMEENDITTEFFWKKFCMDMVILVKSDMKYQSLGNKGLLLPDQN